MNENIHIIHDSYCMCVSVEEIFEGGEVKLCAEMVKSAVIGFV